MKISKRDNGRVIVYRKSDYLVYFKATHNRQFTALLYLKAQILYISYIKLIFNLLKKIRINLKFFLLKKIVCLNSQILSEDIIKNILKGAFQLSYKLESN